MTQPMLNMSDLLEYCGLSQITSGAMNPGLPQAISRLSLSSKSVANPKSAIATPIFESTFEEIRIFAGFISLWIILLTSKKCTSRSN